MTGTSHPNANASIPTTELPDRLAPGCKVAMTKRLVAGGQFIPLHLPKCVFPAQNQSGLNRRHNSPHGSPCSSRDNSGDQERFGDRNNRKADQRVVQQGRRKRRLSYPVSVRRREAYDRPTATSAIGRHSFVILFER